MYIMMYIIIIIIKLYILMYINVCIFYIHFLKFDQREMVMRHADSLNYLPNYIEPYISRDI